MERTLHMPCSSDPFMWASTRAKGHRPVPFVILDGTWDGLGGVHRPAH
jgi:hypothetical protein